MSSAVVSALIVFGARIGLNAVGSAFVGWQQFLEYEIAIATLCHIVSAIGSWLMREERAKAAMAIGSLLLAGCTAAHIAALRVLLYPPTWLTSLLWLGALVGQFVASIGLARALAAAHVRREQR